MKALGSVVLALLVCAAPVLAQVRLGEVAGTVVDESGAVLPGVTITATHVATGQKRVTVTQADGAFVFTALTIGVYEFRAELQGFANTEIRNYRLGLGDSTRLTIQMKLPSVNETVVVQGVAPLVDPTKSDLSGRINRAQVEELPVNGRNWMNFATLVPGVKSDGTGQNADGNAPTSGVGNDRMSKVSLDGGVVQNLSTQSVDLQISKEVIEEFEVITNRFDAVMGHAGTTITNAVTKSGTDLFHGSGFVYLRDDALNAADFFTGKVIPYQNRQAGGTIGGPLVRGRTHFFGSFERQDVPQTLAANTGFPALDAPVDGSLRNTLYFGRLDHTVSAHHLLSVRYNAFASVQPNSNVGGTNTVSHSITNNYLTQRLNAGLTSTLSNTMVNQFSFTWLHSFRQFNRFSGAPPAFQSGRGPVDNVAYAFPSLTLGAAGNVGNERPDSFYFRDDISTFVSAKGKHNIKVGGEYNHEHIQGIFANNSNGTFSYNQNPPNLATCCVGGDQSKWDTSQFPIPARYSQALGDYTYQATDSIYGAYFQDDWTLNPRLTLNLGLRYDVEFGSLANTQSGLAVQPHGNDVTDFAPRIGFAWDVAGTGKTIIRGGGGRYYDQVYLNLTFNQTRTQTGQQVIVTIFNPTNDPKFALDPLGGQTFADFQGKIAGNLTRFSQDARQPNVWTGSIGVAHNLTSDLAVSADFVGQESHSILQSYDTNLFCCLPNGQALPVSTGTYPELGGLVPGAGRPQPQFGSITTYFFHGHSRYSGLQMAMNKRMSHNYQFGLSYLLSKNTDTAGTPSNTFDLSKDYGRSALDLRHRLVGNWLVRLPYQVDLSGIAYIASGRALGTTTGGIDINGDGLTGGDRPTCGLDSRFTAACTFLGVANRQQIPRNPLTSAPIARVDLRLSRKLKTSKLTIDPSIEAFNLLNRKNYDPGTYNTALTSARFGQPGASSNLPYLPRQIQVAVRVGF
jgi:hypothetical protein